MRMGIFSCRRCPNFSKHHTSIIYESINRAEKTLDFFVAFTQSNFTKKLLLYSWLFLLILFAKEVSAQIIDFTLYAIDSTTDELITLDPSTGEPTTIGPIGFSDVNGLAYDSTTNTLLGVDNATGQLIEIDTTTGQGTAIGLIGLGGLITDPGHLGIYVTDLTFGPNNTLFALTNTAFSTSRLITINTETGVGTLVSGDISQQLDGLAFQPRTGKMYASFRFTFIGGLFEIDPTNGDLTDLGPAGIQIFRLSADPNADKLFGIFSSAFPGTTELWSIDLNSLTKSQIGTINAIQISISGLETAIFQAVEGPPGDPTCSDGDDNDRDGYIDLGDSGCQIETECEPINDISINNTRAFGLYEGIIESVTFNDITSVSFSLQPTKVIFDPITFRRRGISLWFSIDEIDSGPEVLSIVPDSADELGSIFADLGLIAPDGHAGYVAQFCGPGEIILRLKYNTLASAITNADSIIQFFSVVSLRKAREFGNALLEVPLYKSAMEHYVNAWQIVPGTSSSEALRKLSRELSLALTDLVRLTTNQTQRTQLLNVFLEFEYNITLRKLLRGLVKAPVSLFEIFLDGIVVMIQQGGPDEFLEIRVIAR